MKKLLCLFSALLMMLLCIPAQAGASDYLSNVFNYPQAEPRYPVLNLPVTDAAAVFGMQTVEDLRTFNEMLAQEAHDDLRLMVVTVDFLDGTDGRDYASALLRASGLEHGMLLLLAVGEDSYHYALTDRDVPVSDTAVSKLLAQRFEPLFTAQRYDEAIAAFVPAFAQEVNKAYDCRISTAGLFGTQANAPAITAAPAGSSYTGRTKTSWDPDAWTRKLDSMDREENRKGIGIGGVLLIVFLLFRVFGRRKRAWRRRHPFLTFMAGWGVFSLFRRVFRGH